MFVSRRPAPEVWSAVTITAPCGVRLRVDFRVSVAQHLGHSRLWLNGACSGLQGLRLQDEPFHSFLVRHARERLNRGSSDWKDERDEALIRREEPPLQPMTKQFEAPDLR